MPAAAVLLGDRQPEQAELGELLPEPAGSRPGRPPARARRRATRAARTRRAPSRASISCSREVEIHRSRARRLRAASARRGGARGCRRVRSGRRRAPCRSVVTSLADRERHVERRPSRSRRRRSSTSSTVPRRAPSCRRGTPSRSCGTASGRAGRVGPVQSVT